VTDERFEFTADVWLHDGSVGWHFVTIPDELADRLRAEFGAREKAFGSLAVEATIGVTKWSTSLFWDSKLETYLLPLKASVRRSEDLERGKSVRVILKPDR
jgi:hypothetical protein